MNNHLAVLGKCLRSAVEWGALTHEPAFRLLKVAPPKFDYLQRFEVNALLGDTAEPFWNAMVRVGLRSGLRLGELLGLEWADVDLVARRITVRRSCWRGQLTSTKTYRVRHVPLTSDAVIALDHLPDTTDFVFGRPDGRPGSRETARKKLHHVADRVGLRRIGWHVLRHTFASTLAGAGVPIHVIQALLGHTSVATTQRYAHLAPNVLANAIAVLEKGLDSDESPILGQPVVNRAHTTRAEDVLALV